MLCLQTACIIVVGCVVASLFNAIVIRCATKLLQETNDTMHLFLGMMCAADLLLTGMALARAYVRLTCLSFRGSRGTCVECIRAPDVWSLMPHDAQHIMVWVPRVRAVSNPAQYRQGVLLCMDA